MPRGQYDRSGNADRSRIEAAIERGREVQSGNSGKTEKPHASPAADAARARGTARTEDNRQQSRGLTGTRFDRLLDHLMSDREVEDVRVVEGGNTILIRLFDDET
jgi:hypothetical protein